MIPDLLAVDLIGYWLGIFLTLAILSFLYKDNPFYKLAEHLFIGISIGYVITQQYYNVLRPKLIEYMAAADHWYFNLALIPLLLVILMFVKAVSKRWSWLGRYPLAFVVALYAGLQINGVAQADLGVQIKRATASVKQVKVDINTAPASDLASLPGFTPDVAKAVVERRKDKPFTDVDEVFEIASLEQWQKDELRAAKGIVQGYEARASTQGGEIYWFGTLSAFLMLIGFIAALIYFYFSLEQKGVVGKVSRFGIWILMIGFGASFGYTVQGRISLAIGRAFDIFGWDKSPADAAQIGGPRVALICIAVIVIGLIYFEVRSRDKAKPNA